MDKKNTKISVIIPHLNQPEELKACLDSLNMQSLDRGLYEVFVVDNGSRDLPEGVVAAYRNVTLLQELAPGPGHARNRGVQEASGNILAFIDADCRAHADWLKNASEIINLAPHRTILGGDVRIWRDNQKKFSALEAYESVFAYRFQLYIEKRGFSGTGNLVMRRCEYDLVGPFKGIDVAEDIDWGQRALVSGCLFRFSPEVVVYHPARRTLRELCIKWDRHIQHAINDRRGMPVWRLRWSLLAIAVLLSPLYDWIKVIGSKRIDGILPRIKAIGVLFFVRTYRAWKMFVLSIFKNDVVWNRDVLQKKS